MRRKVNLAEGALADKAAYCVVADGSKVVGIEFTAVSRLVLASLSCTQKTTHSSNSWYELASCVVCRQSTARRIIRVNRTLSLCPWSSACNHAADGMRTAQQVPEGQL